ncbi:hypothetical protein AAG906_024435 [Vitis piasezkii]
MYHGREGEEQEEEAKHQHPNDQTTKPSSDFAFKLSSEVKGLRFGVSSSSSKSSLSHPPITTKIKPKPNSVSFNHSFLAYKLHNLSSPCMAHLTLGLGTKKSKVLLFVFESESLKVAVDRVWPPEIPLGEVNKKLIRGLTGYEMARFKFRKGCITFYVYAVRRVGNLGFSCADDLRTILQSVVELKDFLDHTAMLAMPHQRSIAFAPPVAMAH